MENQISNIKKNIKKETVTCITLKSLFKKHNIVDLGILQIDTEGFDYQIIKMIDFSQLRPDVIIYEYLHLTHYQYYASVEFLINNGYILNKNNTSFDVIALNKDLF